MIAFERGPVGPDGKDQVETGEELVSSELFTSGDAPLEQLDWREPPAADMERRPAPAATPTPTTVHGDDAALPHGDSGAAHADAGSARLIVTAGAPPGSAPSVGSAARNRCRGAAMTVGTDQRALDELCVNTIRTLSMDAVQQANSGHPGTPMALAPIAYLLYTRVMRHSPEDPHWPGRDRFVLSCGHASMLLYSTLHLAGYDVTLDQIKRFRQIDSPCAGHPEYGHVPGVETTTGPLGQGISTAVGMALGERMLAARFNRGDHAPIDSFTYFIASDGDMEEGISSEASSIAGHLGLGKLIGFYDDNHISIEGDTALAFSEDVGARYEAYGWHVQNLHENLELDQLEAAIDAAQEVDRPPEPDHRAHAHRARLAEQAGHPRRARLAARRGGDPAHQGGLRLPEPRAVLRPRRGAGALPRAASSAGATSRPTGRRRSTPTAPTTGRGGRVERLLSARCPTGSGPTSRRRAPTPG